MPDICDFISGQTFIDTDDERIRQKIERLLIGEKGKREENLSGI